MKIHGKRKERLDVFHKLTNMLQYSTVKMYIMIAVNLQLYEAWAPVHAESNLGSSTPEPH